MTALAASPMREAIRDRSYLETPLGAEVGRYLRSRTFDLSATSNRDYERTLARFAVAFANNHLEDFEGSGGADLIEPWMHKLWGKGSPTGWNVKHSHLASFFDWHSQRCGIQSNPMRLVRRGKKRDTLRETFTRQEVKALMDAASLRDRIALRLLFHHGLRKGALQKVQFKHFDLVRLRLTIFTKGGRIQEVEIPELPFWADLERHVRETSAKPNHFLMCVTKQVPYGMWVARRDTRPCRFPDRMMTMTPLHRWWTERLRDAGVGPYRHLHCARHTFAQMLLDETGDIELARQALGHVSIGTTQMYAQYKTTQVASKLAAILEDR